MGAENEAKFGSENESKFCAENEAKFGSENGAKFGAENDAKFGSENFETQNRSRPKNDLPSKDDNFLFIIRKRSYFEKRNCIKEMKHSHRGIFG